MAKAFESAGQGHRLSTGAPSSNGNDNGGHEQEGGGTPSASMNVSQLRAARLAALERKNKHSTVTSATTSTASPTATATTTTLPSSTKTESSSSASIVQQQPSAVHTQAPSASAVSTPRCSKKSNQTSSSSTTTTTNSDRVSIDIQEIDPQKFSIVDFNNLMWDGYNNTTNEDKKRWFDQGIHTKLLLRNEHINTATSTIDADNQPLKDFDSWGLLQSHGGPCGVLAALQAELITNLYIYENIQELEHQQHQMSHSFTIFDRKEIEQALADSISHILVRSCMAPAIRSGSNNNNNDVYEDNDGNDGKFKSYCVKLILPKKKLNNDQHQHEQNMSFLDPSLLQCVCLKMEHGDQGDDTVTNTPDAKRAKQASKVRNGNSDNDNSSSAESMREMIKNRLCEAVSEYLLSTVHKMNDDDTEQEQDILQLNHFYHYAGVMLLTMSLVATRGVDCIKSDMDAGTAHHLTAQFGHSSQELINLLLTGQATTNIFDNTMTLGGSLQCHGIQSRPKIGYLSQLEALRYCSVGNYYKSPKNPVWVVGSTSHFSVLFGSRECLKESKSDELLEQCRRAFKSIEGAEENGFIPVTELSTVLKQLDLDLKESVETLAASLEMSGAGIILWNDFWKKVSRLKTGALLDSVLQDDEEYARQLQAQFEAEGNANVPSNPQALTSTAIVPHSQNGLNFETYSDHSFQLVHYNGMRGGELVSVTVTRMNAEEAVGADATLVDSSAGLTGNSGIGCDDLESVIRTKFPSCMFDWKGKQPPSLH